MYCAPIRGTGTASPLGDDDECQSSADLSAVSLSGWFLFRPSFVDSYIVLLMLLPPPPLEVLVDARRRGNEGAIVERASSGEW
jgi:hypothetical protein